MTPEPTPSSKPDPTVIDIEAYAKSKQIVPHDHYYALRIDKEKYTVQTPIMSGEQLLRLVGKSSETHLLHQRMRDGTIRTIEPNQKVSLTGEGPERFMTMKREAQEGLCERRREFTIAPSDEAFLNETITEWDLIREGGVQWVVLRGFSIPGGYTVNKSDLAIQLVAGYPEAPLDMAYFHPALVRTGGQAIPATNDQAFEGHTWQRWSRHRTGANPWTPGEDGLATHVAYVKAFVAEELKKRP